MKLSRVTVHNYRTIAQATISVHDYTLLVGANNAGKSTFLSAIRLFFEDIKWGQDDLPKGFDASNLETWVEVAFEPQIEDENRESPLADQQGITLRKYFSGPKVTKKSSCYEVKDGVVEKVEYSSGKSIASLKLLQILYIPALSDPSDHTKLSGPSALRDTIHILLRKAVGQSSAYQDLQTAIKKFEEESKKPQGFIATVAEPINRKISEWKTQIELGLKELSVEELAKSLIRLSIHDLEIGAQEIPLGQYGQGFQRALIYELICLLQTSKSPGSEVPILILFEEPEAYLHPGQQELLSHNLREISKENSTQVVLTTHSPIFVSKAAEDFVQLARVCKIDGKTNIYQPDRQTVQQMCLAGGALLQALDNYVADPNVSSAAKKDAKEMIASAATVPSMLEAEESFRFQLWLESDRAAMFFAEKVLLVEGATEKALFNCLLWGPWKEFIQNRVCVIDVLGKYNFHRFLALLEVYGIPHGVILDDDNQKNHHQVVNDLVIRSASSFTVGVPNCLPGDLETFLGLSLPGRGDKKPIEILKAVSNNAIPPEKLEALKEVFKKCLAL